jgi:hypothetical protein
MSEAFIRLRFEMIAIRLFSIIVYSEEWEFCRQSALSEEFTDQDRLHRPPLEKMCSFSQGQVNYEGIMLWIQLKFKAKETSVPRDYWPNILGHVNNSLAHTQHGSQNYIYCSNYDLSLMTGRRNATFARQSVVLLNLEWPCDRIDGIWFQRIPDTWKQFHGWVKTCVSNSNSASFSK